jgi:hypothetical protein
MAHELYILNNTHMHVYKEHIVPFDGLLAAIRAAVDLIWEGRGHFDPWRFDHNQCIRGRVLGAENGLVPFDDAKVFTARRRSRIHCRSRRSHGSGGVQVANSRRIPFALFGREFLHRLQGPTNTHSAKTQPTQQTNMLSKGHSLIQSVTPLLSLRRCAQGKHIPDSGRCDTSRTGPSAATNPGAKD